MKLSIDKLTPHPASDMSAQKTTKFTLVELLIVVAIIAILMSMLFPALRAGIVKARQISCANNLKTLSIACADYSDNYDGYIPPVWDLDREQRWYNLISKGFFGKVWYEAACFHCESNPKAPERWLSYARNHAVSYSYATGLVKVDSLRLPSRILNLADVGSNNVSLGPAWDCDQSMDYAPNTGYRHNGGANGLFYDGHVLWNKAYFPNEWFLP